MEPSTLRRSASLPPTQRNSGVGVAAPNRENFLRGKGYESRGGRVLSHGSFGALRACVRISDGLVVAVKVIERPTHRYATEKRVLEVAAKSDNPFVLTLIHGFEGPDVACLVTDLCDGDTHDLLAAKRAQVRAANAAQSAGGSWDGDTPKFQGLAAPLVVKICTHVACGLDWRSRPRPFFFSPTGDRYERAPRSFLVIQAPRAARGAPGHQAGERPVPGGDEIRSRGLWGRRDKMLRDHRRADAVRDARVQRARVRGGVPRQRRRRQDPPRL